MKKVIKITDIQRSLPIQPFSGLYLIVIIYLKKKPFYTVVMRKIIPIILQFRNKVPIWWLGFFFTHLLIVSTAHFFLAAFRRPRVPRHQDWMAIAKNKPKILL